MKQTVRITPFGAVRGHNSALVNAAAEVLDSLGAPTAEDLVRRAVMARIARRRRGLHDLLEAVTVDYAEVDGFAAAAEAPLRLAVS